MSSLEQESKISYKDNGSSPYGEDICYEQKDRSYYESIHDKVSKVEILIKALGTMVLYPQYEKSNLEIGKKEYVGTIQVPILLDSRREKALAKLEELIDKL